VLVIAGDNLGSGALIAADKVITCAHVVGDEGQVAIVFKPAEEGREIAATDAFRARVIAIDRADDLALLQVPPAPNGAQPMQLGSQKEFEIGADVHAIGHPTGETWTYTRGIISQYRKGFKWSTEDGLEHLADVIQTQTPINPGNSGGPLISDEGHLIGVNSFKSSGEGLNFAVSADEVRKLLGKVGVAHAADPPKPTPPKECTAKVLYTGRNNQNNANIKAIDWACSGKVGALLVVPDDPTKPIVLMISSLDSGQTDIWFVDTTRRGKWDYELISSKHDGKIDLIGYDIDGNLRASRVEAYNGQVPSTF
jgi:hypothetical protein